jgi:methyltransferase (TIGR00027 family)
MSRLASEPLRPMMRAALYAAANRAAETTRADALYRDPLACDLAGEVGRAVWESMRETTWPGFLSSAPEPVLSIFTRYFDDALRTVVTERGIEQVVILGARLDTRAFRLEWPVGVRLFEVGDGDMFDHQEAVLRRMGARPACRRETIATGCEGAWTGELLRKGFDRTSKTAFLVEGLQFLPEAIAERTMRDLDLWSRRSRGVARRLRVDGAERCCGRSERELRALAVRLHAARPAGRTADVSHAGLEARTGVIARRGAACGTAPARR